MQQKTWCISIERQSSLGEFLVAVSCLANELLAAMLFALFFLVYLEQFQVWIESIENEMDLLENELLQFSAELSLCQAR